MSLDAMLQCMRLDLRAQLSYELSKECGTIWAIYTDHSDRLKRFWRNEHSLHEWNVKRRKTIESDEHWNERFSHSLSLFIFSSRSCSLLLSISVTYHMKRHKISSSQTNESHQIETVVERKKSNFLFSFPFIFY